MEVEKFVSYQIEKQFPALFREDGVELVELVKYYYKFLEETTNQSIYNNRRMFEYRDIDNTLEKFVLFFKNKYMQGLPFEGDATRFAVKNILDLYRRRGTREGVELFFRLFYEESIEIYYPAEAILKPSSSTWNERAFLQLYPVELDSLRDLSGRTVTGSISKASAIVDRVTFTLVNNTFVPILSIENVKGTFVGFDDILSTTMNNEIVNYGKVYGSLEKITINSKDPRATTGNNIGDILNVTQAGSRGGKAIVSAISENVSGEIEYIIVEPGFGYTRENTHLYVSNQTMFNSTANNIFAALSPLEFVEDQFGNRGMVIGGTESLVGFRMNEGSEFIANSVIFTTRANNNIIIVNDSEFPYANSDPVFYFESIVPKNDSSPGPLFPETANTSILSVQLSELSNIETVSLITDVIDNFKNVPLNSSNYNTMPPALSVMSGNTDPITINTPLDQAFNLEPFEIGSIRRFIRIRPGNSYVNRVFALAYDPSIVSFDVHNQLITLETISAAFVVGGIISQGSITGKILAINGTTITVLPYSYSGFVRSPITYSGRSFNVVSVSRDYSSKKLGDNATIDTVTQFAIGKIISVDVVNSGYGYADKKEVVLTDNAGNIKAIGIADARGQGVIEGRWSSTESHLNIQDGKFLQDSDYYQEFSYEISSKTDINTYKNTLDEIVHLAGTKTFGKFSLKDSVNVSSNIRSTIVRE